MSEGQALTVKDFELKLVEGTFGHYWCAKTDKVEVCLESCLNGFDVAIYDLKRDEDAFVKGDGIRLLCEKTCTNVTDITPFEIMGISQGLLNERSAAYERALAQAVEIANAKLVAMNAEPQS